MAGAAAGNEAKKLADAMRKTLNLPHTAFPMRANAAVREPELHARVVTNVYEHQRITRRNAETFVLHDGPPFANGSLHMGHFLNKVLKDIINRYKLMRGFRIDYVPGWDCHGLPIEVKALEKLKRETGGDASLLTPLEVRKLSRELATGAIQDQKQDFERWGVLADWSGDPGSYYVTMDPAYEAKQYDVLKKMVQDELVFRGFKPVYWSPSSRTALAEAELEYADNHVSHAAYIAFPFHNAKTESAKRLLGKYGDSLSCVIWTTTPWTIPANQALCVNAGFQYAIVHQKSQNRHFLVAAELVESFARTLGSEEGDLEVVETMTGDVLEGSLFSHPLLSDRKSVVLLGDHVTADAGTGIVHTAPGHGQDDYFAWISHHQGDSSKAEIICPVDDHGRFTTDSGLESLTGLEVLTDGNKAVIELLTNSGKLLHVSKFKHRYPYDWRTKKPVILRATAQWFAKLDGLHEVGKRVVSEEVETFPKSSRRRLEATLSSRNEWCISRQRAWGLPIPVFYHKETNEPLINDETISFLQKIVKNYSTEDGRKGSDCWWDLPVEQLLPPTYQDVAHQYEKGTDTLDVWFDSGSSWHTVLDDVAPGQLKQADVYLEGSDQHRGWFQSSLLTSVAMQKAAPYKHVITHGFALDERGSKMSKSLGNTIVPKDFIDGCDVLIPNANPKKKPKSLKVPAYGADVLRYWVASTDYTGDVNFGPSVISKVSDSLRKVRNTARFLLANLNDFNPDQHALPYDQLTSSVDQYMLHVLLQANQQITEGYETYAFNRVQSALAHFISADLSAFYMEACKDRLYCDAPDSPSRRSAQTVLWLTLQSLSRAVAPVVCHTAEDIHLHWKSQVQQCELEQVDGSIFTEDDAWLPASPQWQNPALASQWAAIRQLRLEVNRVVEKMRTAEAVGSQLECNVYIVTSDERAASVLKPMTTKADATLENVLLCSGVELVNSAEEITAATAEHQFQGACQLTLVDGEKIDVEIVVTKAKGHKCPRCWKFAPEVDAAETKLCVRCATATNLQSVADLAASLVQE